VLQSVAVCCIVLQCVAVGGGHFEVCVKCVIRVLRCVEMCLSVLQCVAVCCSVVQKEVASSRCVISVLQCVEMCFSMLQFVAVLQCVATGGGNFRGR